MAVVPLPSYQSLMGPFLAAHEDGRDHAVADTRARLAREHGLTEADLEERLPSGGARHFDNRVGWAVTYLYRAGLIERPRRAVYRITDRGRVVLQRRGRHIDNEVPRLHTTRGTRGGGRSRRGQNVPRPDSTTGTVESRISRSRASDQPATYW